LEFKQVSESLSLCATRSRESLEHRLFYHRVPEGWRRDENLRWLGQVGTIGGVEWKELPPHKWLTLENAGEFDSFLPMGTKEAKAAKEIAAEAIFKSFSLGVATNRDEWVYDSSAANLTAKMKRFIKYYNYEVFRLGQEGKKDIELDDFVNSDPSFLKWTDQLREHLLANQTLKFDSSLIRTALYRPFTKKKLYFDPLLNHRQYLQHRAFPTAEVERENITICCTNHIQVPFGVHIANCIPDQAIGGRGRTMLPDVCLR
jgi:predicted helicase